MKIQITECADVREALLAAGICQWLGQMDIPVEAPAMPVNLTMQPIAAAEPPEKPRKYKARAVKAPRAPKAPSAKPAEDKPHVTIRQRILDILALGPKTSSEVHLQLVKRGVPESVNTTQHLYLLKKDRLVTQDDESGRYQIA